MNITGIFFIFIFLPITLISYYLVPIKTKNSILLLISLIFYSWGNPNYLIVLVLSVLFNYFIALEMQQYLSENNNRKLKSVLIFGLLFNVLVLGLFKYYGFFLDNINKLFRIDLSVQELPLPLGISFFTFSVISYLIDIYRKKSPAQRNLISFALYVSFFPKVISGPIMQYTDFSKQLSVHRFDYEFVGHGLKLYIQGLAKKILLADSFSILFQDLNTLPASEKSILSSWLALFAFTLQIFFDFSGYSEMAIGLAKMLGFNLPQNFNYPYVSRSATEFWRRWHMTLGSWFREYVYIPLGGNRVGILKHIRNIMLVWLLTGIWHGAAWNYIFWGLYYGLILLLEKYFYGNLLKRNVIISRVYTIIIVMLGWLIFASSSISAITISLQSMFGIGGVIFANKTTFYYLQSYAFQIILGCLGVTSLFNKLQQNILQKRNRRTIIFSVLIYLALFVFSLAYLVNSTYQSFLYVAF